MVALLWEAREVTAALELETLWNDLADICDFSLYCAYPAAAITDAADLLTTARYAANIMKSLRRPTRQARAVGAGDRPS
jgi:hypothetical protein